MCWSAGKGLCWRYNGKEPVQGRVMTVSVLKVMPQPGKICGGITVGTGRAVRKSGFRGAGTCLPPQFSCPSPRPTTTPLPSQV